jgi:hypothetical protein
MIGHPCPAVHGVPMTIAGGLSYKPVTLGGRIVQSLAFSLRVSARRRESDAIEKAKLLELGPILRANLRICVSQRVEASSWIQRRDMAARSSLCDSLRDEHHKIGEHSAATGSKTLRGNSAKPSEYK